MAIMHAAPREINYAKSETSEWTGLSRAAGAIGLAVVVGLGAKPALTIAHYTPDDAARLVTSEGYTNPQHVKTSLVNIDCGINNDIAYEFEATTPEGSSINVEVGAGVLKVADVCVVVPGQ